MNKTEVILLFSILALLLVLPASFAADNDTAIIGDNLHDYYFDASVENDTGDGSVNNPYKTLTSARIMDDSNIHLANGEYGLDRVDYANNVNIIGSDAEKTVISFKNDVGFNLYGKLTLTNVTLVGLAINTNGENLIATNTIFKNYTPAKQYATYNRGVILASGGDLDFSNCTFAGNDALKGGAISVSGGKLTITDSLFFNNNAEQCGGAISCQKDACVEIYNSRFENGSSNGDGGGAIYLLKSNLIAYNVEINNCSATFGGAITALKSELNLTNLKSRNNRAKYYGGAVYTLFHTIFISNSTFINNSAGNGGALFIDCFNTFSFENNVFANNTADLGSAVYSMLSEVDSIYNNKNNSFENNDNFETDNLVMDFVNDDYMMIMINSGDYDGTLPASYDLRDLGQVSPVKDQGKGGNCWAFSAIAALESALLKATNTTYDLSEDNMKNLMSMYSSYGWAMETNVGGYDKMAIGYLTSGLGPVNESVDAYDANVVLSPMLSAILRVQNILFFTRDNYTDNDAIKRAIMEYGAVSTSIYWSSSNIKGDTYYFNGNYGANHAVVIVGWDDNYDKSNFKKTPESNGAWIIKNSWGTNSGNDGFFYVSYCDTRIAQPGRQVSYVFVLNNTLKYNKIYQYDVQGRTDYFLNDTDTVWYKNRFTATSDEYLAAVSTYFEKDTDWELSVYVNGALKSTKVSKSNPGYYTIDLDHLIELKEGDVFEVIFRITVDGDIGFPISEYVSLNKETYGDNISFMSYDGKTWDDLYYVEGSYPDHTYYSQVACIKAFTLPDKINAEVNIKVIYSKITDVSTIVAYVYDEWGNKARDGNVVFDIDGNVCRAAVIDGKASVNYNLNDDVHNISAKFTGQDYHPADNSIQFIKPSKVNVSFEIADIEYGQDLMAHIFVYDQYGTIIEDAASVKINDLTCNMIVNGDKSYRIPFNLSVGSYVAEISGNDFDGKNVSFTVSKSSADLNLTVETRYNSASITITLSNGINENAVVNVFGRNETVRIINGKASLKYDNLACNKYRVNVYLNGDNYKNNFKSTDFEIDYRNTSLIVSDMTTYYMSGGELNIRLVDSNGNAVSNSEIRVTVNNETEVCITDKNGIAVFEAYLENGIYSADVEFAGDGYYAPSKSSAKITVLTTVILISDLTKTYGSYYKFRLLDTLGNPLKNYEVSVEFNGKNEFIESDSNGVFSLKITKNSGSYKLTITNPVNGEEIANTIKVVARITENKDVTMYYGAGKSYTVKVFDDDGNIAKGVSVSFTINGKTYTRPTDSNGYASFKLTLNSGTYTITAAYKGYKVSNKITIKPTLVMSAKTVKKSKTFKYTVKLLDKNGKIQKNKKVTVKFRGKTYKAKTNSKGIATFNIKSLSKTGKFKLTASYGTAKVSKTITVKK